MSTRDLAYRVKRWIQEKGMAQGVGVQKYELSTVVTCIVYTTKTRASSIATRLRLITQELREIPPYGIVVELAACYPPANREDLASWKITVVLPNQRNR